MAREELESNQVRAIRALLAKAAHQAALEPTAQKPWAARLRIAAQIVFTSARDQRT